MRHVLGCNLYDSVDSDRYLDEHHDLLYNLIKSDKEQ